MTSAAATLLAPDAPAPVAWRTRALEFLLVGGATLVLFPLAWASERGVGLDASELAVGFMMFHAAHVINDPHFSVTYLLFYKDARRRAFGDAFNPAQRVRYLLAAAAVPLVLGVWITLAIARSSAAALGWMMELMFFLVGWHYVKQGFGVLSVLSARRGIQLQAGERRAILAHCFAGWAYAWAGPAKAATEVEEKGVVYTALAHPAWLVHVTGVAFAASAIALVIVLLRRYRRERRLPPLGGLAGLLASIWLWSVYSSLDPLMVYMIPALHSVQYLYFVWLMKRNEAREAEGPPTFGRPVQLRLGLLAGSAVALGWVLFHGAPSLLDATTRRGSPLGATPYFAAFFAFVNIHHYFMDNVIWRRDNPDTRYLRAWSGAIPRRTASKGTQGSMARPDAGAK